MAKPKISKVCETCSGTFSVLAYRVNTARWCSKKCRGATETRSIAERLLDGVQRAEDPMACWLWMGRRNNTGYGIFKIAHKGKTAHRAAWEQANGPIPDGLCVLHRCDNPSCCRVDHLFLGTKADNTLDMLNKGRHSHGARHTTSKLTEHDMRAIRDVPLVYGSGRRLAKQFGVSEMTISQIRHGQTWYWTI